MNCLLIVVFILVYSCFNDCFIIWFAKTAVPDTNIPCIIPCTFKPTNNNDNAIPKNNNINGIYLFFITLDFFKNNPSIYITGININAWSKI